MSRRVAIIGVGEIGGFLAERLSAEQFDVVVMDHNPQVLSVLANSLDVASELGAATSLADLEAAGVSAADVLIAATHHDETNLVCCLLAEQLGVAHKIAITRHMSEGDQMHRYMASQFHIDLLLNFNEAVCDEIMDILQTQGASEMARFADGKIMMLGVAVNDESPLLGRRLQEVFGDPRRTGFHVTTLVRDGLTLQPQADSELVVGDYLYVFATRAKFHHLEDLLGAAFSAQRTAVISGSNTLAQMLARALLARWYRVTMLVEDEASERQLMEQLGSLAGLHCQVGESTKLALQRRCVEGAGVFIAAAERDETNLMACLLAHNLDVPQTIAIIKRADMAELALQVGVSAHIAPRLATAKSLQRVIHQGRLLDYKAIAHSNLEAIELEVLAHSRAAGKIVADLKLPEQTVLGGIISQGSATLPEDNIQLMPGDRLIALTNPSHLLELQALFAPS